MTINFSGNLGADTDMPGGDDTSIQLLDGTLVLIANKSLRLAPAPYGGGDHLGTGLIRFIDPNSGATNKEDIQIGNGKTILNGIEKTPDGGFIVYGQAKESLYGKNFGGATDAFVIKYNASRIRQWIQTFNTQLHESIAGASVDASGNILLSGRTSYDLSEPRVFGSQSWYGQALGGRYYAAFSGQLSSSGDLNWVNVYGGLSGGLGIAADSNGYLAAIYTGVNSSPTNYTYFDKTNKVIWSRDLQVNDYSAAVGVFYGQGISAIVSGISQVSLINLAGTAIATISEPLGRVIHDIEIKDETLYLLARASSGGSFYVSSYKKDGTALGTPQEVVGTSSFYNEYFYEFDLKILDDGSFVIGGNRGRSSTLGAGVGEYREYLIANSPSPIFLLATSSSSINEGTTLATTVSTSNVASGTTLYWSVSGTGVNAADLSSGALTGSGTVGTDGKFSLTHNLANDLTTEGDETLQIKLFSDTARTIQVGSTATVTVKDTSIPIVRGNSLYTIVDGPSWTQAEANSVKLGGHLTSISSKSENDLVQELAKQNSDPLLTWIGGTDEQKEGVWKWTTGEPWAYTNWSASEPTNNAWNAGIAENYLAIYKADGTWNDNFSGNWAEYTTTRGISETSFIRRGDSAYVIVQGPTWEEAEANAVKLGGHLVTINDAAENDWVTKEYSKPDYYYDGDSLSSDPASFTHFWLGAKQNKAEGIWSWLDGSGYGFDLYPPTVDNFENLFLRTVFNLPSSFSSYNGKTGFWWNGVANDISYQGGGILGYRGIAEIKLAPNNTPTGIPTLSGTPKSGQVITIDRTPIQDADNFTGYTPTYNYSFEVSSDNGATWTKLTSADATDNNSTYTLTTAEVGKQVRGVVSYLDGYGTNESVASDASILVLGNQAPTDIIPSTPFINFNSKAGSAVLSLSTLDPDAGGSFTYALVAGTGSTDNTAFTLTSNQLSIKAVPVPSNKKTYSIRVRSTDQGGLSFEKSLNLSLNFAPTALNSSTTGFRENIEAGSVVSTLSSIDPDAGNTFTYSLVSGTGSTDNAAFSISSNQLKINASPDFETKPTYSVRVRTTDQSGLFFEKSISLVVANVNEAPTGISASSSNFNENVAAGSVVATFASTDPDKSSTFTYSLVTSAGSTDNAAFSISGNQLKIKASPDYETKSSYSIRVQTKDQGGLIFEKSLTFTVNDLNEAPTNITTAITSFNENLAIGTVVATLGSTSSSSANIFTYALVVGTGSTDNGAFSITGNQLKISGSPDFETKSSYSIRVQTKDQGGLVFEKSLVFTVNNLNEAPTALTVSSNNFNENITAGSVVATLASTDPDKSSTFTYSLVTGAGSTDNGAFSISGSQLKITASPDYEAKKSYQIRVRTTDQGGLTFEKDVVLSVNNLVEKVSSSASSTLAPTKDTLELTGARNIFGTGNQLDNTITGNSGKNKLTGGMGKDILTGGAGADTFFYSSLKDSLLSGFDVITDYASGEKISTGFDFEGDDLIDSTGKVSDLNAAAIGSVLTNTTFLASNAAVFTVEGLTGTFLALNDGRDGFQADSDALIHLNNYTIGSTTPISII